VDEAHSIGALGPQGRGVCDYYGIDPRRVDILMGTFTKSFGAAGGYVAGSKNVIDRIRLRSAAGPYAEAMAPAVLMQVVASMASIMGVSPPLPPVETHSTMPAEAQIMNGIGPFAHPGPAPASLLPSWVSLPPALADGSEGRIRLRRLTFNARYLHTGLYRLGFITYGHVDSPIIPMLTYNLGKMPILHRMMKQRRTPIAVVVVAYPATPLLESRVRFCVSASHTKDDIDEVLRACDEIGSVLDLKHGVHGNERWPLARVLASAEELVKEGRVA
jgi:serine palmitoyltransferase